MVLPSYDTSSFHWPNEIWTEPHGLSYIAETKETKSTLRKHSNFCNFRAKLKEAWWFVAVSLLFTVLYGLKQKSQMLFSRSNPTLCPTPVLVFLLSDAKSTWDHNIHYFCSLYTILAGYQSISCLNLEVPQYCTLVILGHTSEQLKYWPWKKSVEQNYNRAFYVCACMYVLL